MAYIDAEILKRNIRVNLMPNVDIDGTVTVENAERYFLNLIDKTSTADVVKVKHGRWHTARKTKLSKTVQCTVCDMDFYFKVKGQLNIDMCPYCPNCGAKMDGRRDE